MKLTDLSKDELNEILKVAADYKKNRHGYQNVLENKTIGTIFLKNSTRTRVSFETGINQLGGYPMYLDDKSLQIGRGESFHDTAKVLSRYLEGIVIRGHEHESIKEFADACDIPVINALTDKYHPCQLLADMQAMIEVRGSLEGAKVAFYGDCASNMANSFVLAASMTGMDLRMAGPQGYQPEKWLMDEAGNPSNVTVTDDAMAAAKDCDFLVTDVWISMGFEEEAAERSKIFMPYQLNKALLKEANSNCKVMHCLPAYREKEITAEVLEGPQSIIWDEAENRLHAQKAAMSLLFN